MGPFLPKTAQTKIDNMSNTSNFLPDFRYEGREIKVQIITTSAHTTAYQIQQTQGAEYGTEAEKLKELFENAPRVLRRVEALRQEIQRLKQENTELMKQRRSAFRSKERALTALRMVIEGDAAHDAAHQDVVDAIRDINGGAN